MSERKKQGLFGNWRDKRLERRSQRQRSRKTGKQTLLPEGFGTDLALCAADVAKAAAAGEKLTAYVDSYRCSKAQYQLLMAEDGTCGVMHTDAKLFEASGLVGLMIDVTPKECIDGVWSCVREVPSVDCYKVGDELICKVITHLGYGAIVDIGAGVTAFIHISDMCVGDTAEEVKHPSQVLRKGQFCRCEVIARKGDNYKLRLLDGEV